MHMTVLRRVAECCAAILPLLITTADRAPAAAPLTIVAVLPAEDGAMKGVLLGTAEAERTASLLRQEFTLHVGFASGAAAADTALRMLREHDAQVLIGGADAAAASALMDAAEAAGVLFLNIGAADDSLRTRCSAFAFHVAPSAAMLHAAASGVDTGRHAAGWHDSLERYGAGQVNDRFRAQFGGVVGEREWAGWLAVKIAWEAAQRAPSGDAHALAAYLTRDDVIFDGHKGLPLSFRPRTHQLRQPVYIIAGDSVTAEVPSPRDAPAETAAALLDRLAAAGEEQACVH
jgi:hypothetical protein